ncbi:hypothetical protein FLONG3_6480 [Fusarium longipes]|uniref:BZIP domain-containing protein n=1 Tax=Fusarium longipes TaxID=694270 RepID=A0A395SL61_9HYPO|nr:hypothetical protein FLONG3_6480 [Fusarium longipes]
MSPMSTVDANLVTNASTSDGGVSASGPRRGRRPAETPVSGSVSNRRRMQNRMAQRAYRQRKESAIDILKQKVEELEKSKEDIGKEFLEFTTVILEKDSVRNCPEIVEHIKKSTINILTSARQVDENTESEDQDTGETALMNDVSAEASTDYYLSTGQVNNFGFAMVDDVPHLEFDSQFDQNTSTQPTPILHYEYNTPSSLAPCGASSYFHLPINQTPDHTMYQLPGATHGSSMHCPRSYSSQEATFGRRYHRAASEAAFLLASMKHSPPTWYKKVFGFCMHFETREEISQRLGDSIRKSRDMTLNNWRFPFTNVGGAGTFYPDQGFDSSELPIGNRSLRSEAYRPSEMSGFSIGPFGPSIEQVRDLRLNPQLRMIDPDYDGDFFDSDEIEICLRGYGVTIPASKDFVTAYIDMEMFQRADTREAAQSQADDQSTPLDTLTSIGDPGAHDPQSCGVEPASFYCPAGMLGMAMGAMPPPPKPQLQEQWKTPLRRETKVKIDVERLITCLCNSTVCLGRTPAVRPKDIRRALKMALIDED